MTLNLDDLDALEAVATKHPYISAIHAPTVLTLIAKLREAEAVIAKARHELSARPIPHGVSQAIYYQAFMVRADMALAAYEPTNQEGES